MKFKATDSQLRQIVANAINESRPTGMGLLHYKETTYSPDELVGWPERQPKDIHVDYYEGRMVKLRIRGLGDGTYEIHDSRPRHDYQSWAGTYETNTDLVNSVEGIEIVEAEVEETT